MKSCQSLAIGIVLCIVVYPSLAAEPQPYPRVIPVKSISPAPPMRMGADGLQPAGIMLGHGDRWMASYEFMFERMRGNLDGSERIGTERILESFFAAPTEMRMQMHMASLMYSFSDELSLMAMVPYLVKNMDHVTVDGERFAEKTEGLGDIEVRAHYSLYEPDSRHSLFVNAGVALPTGSIDERMNGMRLEYPMQLGAGTVSLIPGLTYLAQEAAWSWGAELIPTLRLGQNDNDYRLGDQYRLSVWAIRPVNEFLNLSARADARQVENIRGADLELDPMDEQTKDPALQGGRRLDLLLGVTFRPWSSSSAENQRIYLEAGVPAYQSLDGPQLKTSYLGRLNWQWHFN